LFSLRRNPALAMLMAVLLVTVLALAHAHGHVDFCGHPEHDHNDCAVCLIFAAVIAALPVLLLLSPPAVQARRLKPVVVVIPAVGTPLPFFRRGPPIG